MTNAMEFLWKILWGYDGALYGQYDGGCETNLMGLCMANLMVTVLMGYCMANLMVTVRSI
jgi:hypothetical protein